MTKYNKAKAVVATATAYCLGTGMAAAQGAAAGGLETAVVGTTSSFVDILKAVVPFILVALVIWAAILIGATRRNYLALACVALAAFVISQVDNIILLAQSL